MGLELEFTEGMQFDKGYISPYFVTDPERMEAVLEDAYILIHQGKISSMPDLLPLLEKVVQAGKPLLIVAEDVDGEALSTLVVNKIRGTFNVGRGQGAGFGDRRKAMLRGHRDPHRRPGRSPRRSASSWTRSAWRCSAPPAGSSSPRTTPRSSTVPATRATVADRVAQIRAEIERTDSDWDREKLQERLAKLAGGVCVHQGRRGHRGRAQGEEAPPRGRHLGDPRGHRGGHRRRRRLRAGARGRRARRRPRPAPATRRPVSRIVRKARCRAAALDRRERGPRGLRRDRQGRATCRSATASTPPPASTAT